jgi:NADPH:quinone reductase-like Zn-dependent oxidoreductase
VLTAWRSLFDLGHLESGQRILIHGGSGGVGHFAVTCKVERGLRRGNGVDGKELHDRLGGDLLNETPRRPQTEDPAQRFYPDRSFSDHCRLLVRFSE